MSKQNNTRFRNLLLLVFSIIVIIISAVGYYNYEHHSQKIRREKEIYLTSIVNDLEQHIDLWYSKIEGFGKLVSNSPSLYLHIHKLLSNNSTDDEKIIVDEIFRPAKVSLGFEEVTLMDDAGVIIYSLENKTELIDKNYQAFCDTALKKEKFIFSDFYLNSKKKNPQLSFHIPIFTNSSSKKLLGTLNFICTPEEYIYRFSNQWPIPSSSGEVFISKREANRIVFLSPLRFNKNAPLKFWLPDSTSDLPAALAERKLVGIVEAKDYRGVEVLASIKKIKSTGWSIVAKEDVEEIFAESNKYLFYSAIVIWGIIPISGLVLIFIWTSKQRDLYQKLFTAQRKASVASAQLENIFKYANDIIILFDKNGKILHANEKASTTYLYTIDDFRQLHIDKLHAEPLKVLFAERIKKIFASKDGVMIESLHRKKNGTTFPVEVSARKITIDEHDVVQIIIRDITERKEREKALEYQQTLFKQLFENSPLGIVLLNDEGNVKKANKGFAQLFQFTDGECFDRFLDELIVPGNNMQQGEKLFDTVMEKKSVSTELVRMKKDKSLVDVSLLAYPIIINEKVEGVFAIYSDITEKKISENRIKQSEERFRLVAEQTGQLIYDYNIISGKIGWAGAIETLTGFSSTEFQSFDIDEWEAHIHPADIRESLRLLDEAKNSGQIYKAIYRFKRKDGSYFIAEDNGVFLYDENKIPYRMLGAMSDITARNRIETSLRENEKRYRSVVESLNQAYYEADKRGVITYCNPGLYEVSGFAEVELNGMIVYRLVADEHRKMVMSEHKKWMNEKATDVSMEFLVQTKFGRIFWVEQHTHYEYDTNGIFVKATNTLRDIDERKRAEEIINKRLEFEKIIASISSRFINVNPNQVDAEINIALESVGKVTGSDRSSLFLFSDEGKTFSNSHEWYCDALTSRKEYLQNIPSEDFRWCLSRMKEFETIHIPDLSEMPEEATNEKKIYESQDIQSFIVVPLHSSDVLIGFLSFDTVLRKKNWPNEDILVLNMLGEIISNTLMRVQSETAMKRSEAKYRSIFETTAEGICGIDTDENIKYCNPQFANMLGYSLDELIGFPYEKFIVGDEVNDFRNKFDERREGKRDVFDRVLLHKSGKKIFARVAASPDFDESGNFAGSFGMFTDITEKINLVDELTIAKDKAEEMNRVKSYFFANMSHELRTPLIGILGFSEVMRDSLSTDEELQSMSEIIYNSGQRLLNTLNMILNISKLEASSMEIKLVKMDILPALISVHNTYRQLAIKANLDYQLIVEAKEIVCNVDANLVNNIFDNLINNAIKFTHEGIVKVVASIKSQTAIITVTDTGVGIPKEKLGIVWHEFRQASEGLSRSFEGTGLGLTIAKKYAEAMGGGISVESEENAGTTFTVEFPLADTKIFQMNAEQKTESIEPLKPESDSPTLIMKNILLVEDDYIAVEVTRKILSPFYKLDFAVNAEEALEKVRANNYDGILMDINLRKGMDGVMCTQEIRKLENYKEKPIIAITAFAMEDEKNEFLSKGMSHYISKPFTKKDLLNLMSEIFIG